MSALLAPELVHVGRYIEHERHHDITWVCADDCPHHPEREEEAA